MRSKGNEIDQIISAITTVLIRTKVTSYPKYVSKEFVSNINYKFEEFLIYFEPWATRHTHTLQTNFITIYFRTLMQLLSSILLVVLLTLIHAHALFIVCCQLVTRTEKQKPLPFPRPVLEWSNPFSHERNHRCPSLAQLSIRGSRQLSLASNKLFQLVCNLTKSGPFLHSLGFDHW